LISSGRWPSPASRSTPGSSSAPATTTAMRARRRAGDDLPVVGQRRDACGGGAPARAGCGAGAATVDLDLPRAAGGFARELDGPEVGGR